MSPGYRIHNVGHHLQKEAVSAAAGHRDAYARSAFNRYYYSAFLNTRALLESLDPSWSSRPHAHIPSLLKKTVCKELKRARYNAQKIGDKKLVSQINSATAAVEQLAEIMKRAYGVRVVADYEQNEHVSFDRSPRFSLRSIDISDAHEWEQKTQVLCTNVSKVWNQIHG